MTKVFYASTLFGLTSLAAAIDAGRFGGREQRRLLVVSNNVPIPELAAGVDESSAFTALRHRFDEVVRWNDVVAPMHPSHWRPPDDEIPMLSRLISGRLGVSAGVTELVVESITVDPAASIATLLRDCPITVYADGLRSWGPTRSTPRPGIGRRITRLLHPDLVPELTPLLLREYEVVPEVVTAAAFAGVVAELATPDSGDAAAAPVIVGQHLAQLGLMTADEEIELQLRMVRAVAARGDRQIVFLPHPAAARPHPGPLRDEATRLGVELVVVAGVSAESWFAAARPSLVVSCFSTGLVTAARHHGLEVAALGTDLVLERIAPYENSNRIPATIVDATVPRLQDDGSTVDPPPCDVARLVDAVGFCMQADRLPGLRAAATGHLAEHGRERYFKKRRLEMLGLIAPLPPAAPKPPPPPPGAPVKARRVARRLFDEARAVTDKRRSAP